MSVLKLLASDNYIPVNRDLIKIFGLEEAVILGELCNEYNYWEREDKLVDDMFYCSAVKLEERTGLSEYQQRKALQKLKDAEVIHTELKGLPATKYFKINTDKILSFLQTSSKKTKELVPKKLESSNTINNKTINSKEVSISKDIDTAKFEFGTHTQPKMSLYHKCVTHIIQFTKNDNTSEVKNLLLDFLDSLVEMKKLRGERQFVGILNKLEEYGHTEDEQIKIIKNSI